MTAAVNEIADARRPHVLYRFYDAAGALLYVGITCNRRARFAAHRKAPWASEAVRSTVEPYPDRTSAHAAEIAAIAAEHPRHNVNHRPYAASRTPVTADYAAYIARLVAAAPPLTDEQRDRLSALLRPAGAR